MPQRRSVPRKWDEVKRSRTCGIGCERLAASWQTLGGARRIWVGGITHGSVSPLSPPPSAAWMRKHLYVAEVSQQWGPQRDDHLRFSLDVHGEETETEPGVRKGRPKERPERVSFFIAYAKASLVDSTFVK